MSTAIQSQGLTLAYHDQPVLFNVNAQIQAGQLTAIIGPNGAGKSTLVKALLNLEPPLTGQVRYYLKGQAYTFKEVRKQIAYVPQNSSVDWDFPTTVLDTVVMGRYGQLGLFKRPGQADRTLALKALDQMAMADLADRQIGQLSGGQRQRVFLARALVQEADFYLLDEPLAGVDIKTEKIIMITLADLCQSGRTVLVVHHNLNTVASYFDRVLLLNRELIAQGPVQTTFTDEMIRACYQLDAGQDERGEGHVRDCI